MCSLDVPVWSKYARAARGYWAEAFVELAWLGFLVAPWLIAWSCLAHLSGWPLNDDPFYAKPLAFWADEGRIQAVRQYGYLTASSVAHTLMGAVGLIDGFGYRQLYLVCIAQQALGACAIYYFARRLRLSRTIAGIGAASLMVYPLYFGHAFTFMTDGPAAAWSCLASVALTLGLIEGRRAWLIAGALAVGWGYWIRQTNGALLLAPCIALLLAWFRPGGKLKASDAWPMLVALTMILALESGWILPASAARLSDVAPQPGADYWKRTLIAGYGWLLLAGWYALPLAPWLVIQAWNERHRSDKAALRFADVGAGLVVAAGMIPFVATAGRAYITNATGSFIQNGHFGPIFLSDMDEPGRWGTLGGVQWPALAWQTLTLLSILSAGAVGWWASWACGQTWRSRQASLARPLLDNASAWLIMLAAAVAALAILIEPHMDRYWLFLMPILTVFCLLLAAERRWQIDRLSVAWGSLCLALQLGMSVVFVHDMLAWNNARWQFVNAHMAAGHAAESIDAGRDVNAWLRMDEDPDTSARPGDTSRWWSGQADICISTGPRPHWELQTQLPWHSWATGQTHFLLVLRRSSPDG